MKKCYIFGHKFEPNPEKDFRWRQDYRCIYCDTTTNRPEEDKFKDTFWKSDTLDTIKFWTAAVLTVASIASAIILMGYFVDNSTCNQYKNMGIDVIYNFWTGCMANHPKFGWIPVEKYFEVLNLYVK